MSDLNLEGMALANGVVETIVSLAAKEVEGVAGVGGSAGAGGLLSALQPKSAAQGVDVTAAEDGTLAVEVHISAWYGSVLPDVAARIRQAVADAVLTQVGVEVGQVDVFVDGVQFAA